MAMYTIELKKILKNNTSIGLDVYPIYDESYREILNRKIEDHFYNREIGTETIDMFVFMMARKMNEIMPYYNQLYESAKLEFDPLVSMGTVTESESNNDSESQHTQNDTSESTNTGTGKSRVVNSQLPQVHLQSNADYATSATDTISDNDAKSNVDQKTSGLTTGNETGRVKSSTKGFLGSQSDLLMRYRNTLINIDMMIISELEPLFMQIWSDNSEYFPHRKLFISW